MQLFWVDELDDILLLPTLELFLSNLPMLKQNKSNFLFALLEINLTNLE